MNRSGNATDPRALRVALLAALASHALVIFGVSFEHDGHAPADGLRVDVTLVSSPDAERPAEARVAAQQNQRGEARKLEEGGTPRLSPGTPVPARESQPPSAAGSAVQGTGQKAILDSHRTSERVVDQSMGATQQDAPRLPRALWAPRLTVEHLSRSLPGTGAGGGPARVRRLDDTATYASSDAEYLHLLQQRLEQVGNVHYPRAAERYGITGSLELLMTVRADGNLESVSLLRSSGHALLDAAAQRIVRLAAPYAPFPEALRTSADKLEIVRTWHFGEKQLSSK